MKPFMGALSILAIASLIGCAGSFEEARLVGLKSAPPAAPRVDTRDKNREEFCRAVDNARSTYSALAKAATVATGAEGLAMIPLDRKYEPWLVGTIAFTGIVGAYCYVRTDSLGNTWARECT